MSDIEYRFGTGQGDPRVHHSQANVDVDGDGVADGVALDFDGDGRIDDVLWDADGDGIADTALLDRGDDGKAESAYHDPTGQGTWNAEGRGGNTGATPPPAEAPPPAEPTPEAPRGHEPHQGEPEQSSEYEPYNGSGNGLFESLVPKDGQPNDEQDGGLFDDLMEHASNDDSREEWYDDLNR